MFSCEKCDKELTEKRNLLRHMKTHVDSSQTCSCGVCGKEFSRADNRKRHEAAHSYSLTCGVCGQYFNSLARHRVHHERPEAKQRLPMKRPAAPEAGPSTKQRRTVSPPPRTPMENPVGPDVLPEDPETRALYRQHWQSIRTEEATGNRIHERYNFTLHEIWQRPPFQRWYGTCTDSRPQPSRSACLLVLSYGTSRLECCGITTVARTTPDSSRRPPHQNRRRLGEGFGGVKPTWHPGVHPATETRYQVGRSSADQRDPPPFQVKWSVPYI